MHKRWFRVAVVVLVMLFTTGAAMAASLLTLVDDERVIAKAALFDPAYRALAENPATASLRLVQAHPDLVTFKTPLLRFDLGPGLQLTARQVGSYATASGSLVWSGVVLDPGTKGLLFDAANTAMLVRNGDKLTGNVYYDGEWFQIRPLRQGLHAVVAVDRSKLPPDHTEAYERLPVIPMPRGSGHELKLIAQTSIRVMVNYTAAAAAASGDINSLIDLAVAETNQGYDNSGVQIDLILANKSQVTYTETGVDSTDLARYRGTSDGYMDSIHSTRSANTADVGILLVANAGGCGLASGIGSSFSTAFALVRQDCATGNYSFGHEIGHLQSARHDPATDPTNTPYPFGHGYRYTGSPAWRTIMAYPCPTVSCPRLNNWSTPYRTKNGLPMGTVSQSNNVRVLNTTKTTVAGFFAPACIPDGGVDDTLYVTSCCSGYAVQGSTYCTNPADYGTTWASCKHVCGTAPVNGCIPSGGIDDILGLTSCCSGAAVAGSGWCLDQTDWGTNWASCVQTCQ